MFLCPGRYCVLLCIVCALLCIVVYCVLCVVVYCVLLCIVLYVVCGLGIVCCFVRRGSFVVVLVCG